MLSPTRQQSAQLWSRIFFSSLLLAPLGILYFDLANDTNSPAHACPTHPTDDIIRHLDALPVLDFDLPAPTSEAPTPENDPRR